VRQVVGSAGDPVCSVLLTQAEDPAHAAGQVESPLASIRRLAPSRPRPPCGCGQRSSADDGWTWISWTCTPLSCSANSSGPGCW